MPKLVNLNNLNPLLAVWENAVKETKWTVLNLMLSTIQTTNARIPWLSKPNKTK